MEPDSDPNAAAASAAGHSDGLEPVSPFRRIPELDGLRGVAILLVLIWHYAICRFAPQPGSVGSVVWSFLGMTWSGVDLFFVLSGFLIGGILLDHRDSTHYFKTFYIRRVCRIFPLYFLVVFAFFGASSFRLDQSSGVRQWLFGDPMPFWSYVTFTQNFAMAEAGRSGANGLAVTWSLAIEEQFYLLFPLLIRHLPKLKLPEVLLFCIAAAPVFRIGAFLFYQVPTAAGNLLMPCRIDALLLGALVACCLRSQDLGRKLIENRARIYAAFALLLAGVLVMCFTMPHFASVQMTIWGRSWLALFYVTLLLIPLLDRNGLVAALLRNRLLQRVGTVSYGVYLLHQPVFGLTAMLISGGESNSVASHLFITILATVFTFATAALLYQWVEKPVLKIGHAHKF